MPVLHVHVSAHIDDGEGIEEHEHIHIPETYDAADVRAMIAREVEDAAFRMLRREYGRAPSRDALVAAVARLRAIEAVLEEEGRDLPELRQIIRAFLVRNNAEVSAEWGHDPE